VQHAWIKNVAPRCSQWEISVSFGVPNVKQHFK
jgi:hypothetical protein